MTFLTTLGVKEVLCSFRLVLEGKAGKEIPESSRLENFQNFFPDKGDFIQSSYVPELLTNSIFFSEFI